MSDADLIFAGVTFVAGLILGVVSMGLWRAYKGKTQVQN